MRKEDKTAWKLSLILSTNIFRLKSGKKLLASHRLALKLYQEVIDRNTLNQKEGKEEFHYTIETLGNDLGMGEKAARRVERALEDATLISVDRSPSHEGRDKLSGNRVSLEPLWSLVDALQSEKGQAMRNKQVAAIKKETGRITQKQKRQEERNKRVEDYAVRFPLIPKEYIINQIKDEKYLNEQGTRVEWVLERTQKTLEERKIVAELTKMPQPPAKPLQSTDLSWIREMADKEKLKN